jgi:sugar phosphate isomerase/epimerase
VKLAIFSDDLAADFRTAARLAAGHGLHGIGVRNVWGRRAEQLSAQEMHELRRIAGDHGLEISALGSQFGRDVHLDDGAALKRAESRLARMAAHAAVLGTPRIRIFTLWLRGQDELSEWARRPAYPGCLDALAERLAPSVAIAEDAGVTLMIELEGASYVGTVSEARQLLERVASTALALCWDVANGWWSGEPPVPDGLEAARGLPIADVQTKEVRADPADPSRASFERPVVGEGDVPYRTILRTLAERGYDGYVTAERVYHPRDPDRHPELQRDALADLAAVRALIEEIAGGLPRP